jgi:hypothetical protein
MNQQDLSVGLLTLDSAPGVELNEAH